nr:hypothetical protein [Calliblepharis sp.]
MNIQFNTAIKIKKLNSNNNTKIVNFIYKTGIIAGTKKINNTFIVPIIEFKDHSRIWMLAQEIEPL